MILITAGEDCEQEVIRHYNMTLIGLEYNSQVECTTFVEPWIFLKLKSFSLFSK